MKQSMQVQRLSELSVFFNRINGTRQQFVVREHVQSLLENRDRARNPVGVWSHLCKEKQKGKVSSSRRRGGQECRDGFRERHTH